MKIHRITCLVIDPNHPDTPAQEYANMLENCRHVNPSILLVESAEIGEWDDDHPLNNRETRDAAISKAFAPPVPTDAVTRHARAIILRNKIRALEEQIDALPDVYAPWEQSSPGFWVRDNPESEDFVGAEIEQLGDHFDWSLVTGELGSELTLEAAKEAADNAAKAQGAILT